MIEIIERERIGGTPVALALGQFIVQILCAKRKTQSEFCGTINLQNKISSVFNLFLLYQNELPLFLPLCGTTMIA